MANTKVTANVIADNAVGITQLNVSDGSNGQALTTNGSGTLSFSTISSYTDSDVETYLDGGTSTPTFADLNVSNTSGNAVIDVIANNSTGLSRLNLGDSDGSTRGGLKYDNSNDSLVIRTSGADKVIIDQHGQMLITGSVSSPTAPEGHLHINQNVNGNSNVNLIIDSNAPNIYFMEKNTTDKNWKLYHNAGDFAIQHVNDDKTTNFTSITFYDNGNIGAPTGSNIYNASDQRLKKNISSLTEGLSIINALNPVTFNWIDDFVKTENDKTMYGFVAQEVQDVFADAVETFVDSTIDVNGTSVETPLRVNEKFIVPVLVKALQEQQKIIDDLNSRIETLENA